MDPGKTVLMWLAIAIAVVFALRAIEGFGTRKEVKNQIPWLVGKEWVYGAVLVALVGIVIIGGIKRIASTAEKIVPLMCGLYVVASLTILAMNYAAIPAALRS